MKRKGVCAVLVLNEEHDGARLEAELADVRARIESEKHRLKRKVGNTLAIEAAETELRCLPGSACLRQITKS
jgi:hypothetical protein